MEKENNLYKMLSKDITKLNSIILDDELIFNTIEETGQNQAAIEKNPKYKKAIELLKEVPENQIAIEKNPKYKKAIKLLKEVTEEENKPIPFNYLSHRIEETEEFKQVSLKKLVEIAKERDKPKIDPDKKAVYSFRLTKKTMDKLEHYINKEKLNKTIFMEDLINNYFKDKIIERQVFNYKIGLILENRQYHICLNNKLDIWIDGSYKANKRDLTSHEGLTVLYDQDFDKYHFIHLFFSIDFNTLPMFKNIDYKIISYETAMELAIKNENVELQEELLLKFPSEKEMTCDIVDGKVIGVKTRDKSIVLEEKIEKLQSELEKEKEDKKKLERNMKILFEDLEKMHMRDKEISKKLNKIDIKKLEELLDKLQT